MKRTHSLPSLYYCSTSYDILSPFPFSPPFFSLYQSSHQGLTMTAKEFDDPEFFLPADFLPDDFFKEPKIGHEENPTIVMGSSPQSTLNGIGSWSFSSNDSPDGPSTPLKPPSDNSLHLLNAAVSRFEKLSLESNLNRHVDFLRIQEELINQQLRAVRFYQMKQLQLVKLQQQYANAVCEKERRANPVKKNGLSFNEWPPLQKQAVNVPGTTAVRFNVGMRRSTGTGVFLPRQPGAQTPEPRRRQGGSTHVKSEKVHAPNVKVNEMGFRSRMQGCNVHENDRKRNAGNGAAPVSSSEALRLPQEWTY